MALDAVKLEIDKSANEAISAIASKADAEVAEIISSADTEISAIDEKWKKKLKDTIDHLRRQELSSAELESKRIVLAKKKEILSRLFVETLKSLESAPENIKLEQYKKMINASKGMVNGSRARISPEEKVTAEDLGVSSLIKDSKILGGVILENEDGSIRIDMQYATILQAIWNREVKKLSDILFG
ncbi:MAG: hypothetical protein MJY64_01375 [archaeon]|nr:hypothetical protein [archaeon]